MNTENSNHENRSRPAVVGKSTTIRLGEQLDHRVRRLADNHGIKASVIIRSALHSALHTWERHGVQSVDTN